jgi:acyl-CoA synthetase (AMP-forming)/AMP-acid ligase II
MTTLDAKAREISPQPTRSTTWRDNRLTIAHRLEHHARSRPDGRAFSFLEDGDGLTTRTWADLAAGARAVAAVLSEQPRTQEQPRALLLLPQDGRRIASHRTAAVG